MSFVEVFYDAPERKHWGIATNRYLPDAVAQDRLRSDLYYRVNVFDIRIPPLRERHDDIIVLAESFLREFSRAIGRRSVALTASAWERLLAYEWPATCVSFTMCSSGPRLSVTMG